MPVYGLKTRQEDMHLEVDWHFVPQWLILAPSFEVFRLDASIKLRQFHFDSNTK